MILSTTVCRKPNPINIVDYCSKYNDLAESIRIANKYGYKVISICECNGYTIIYEKIESEQEQ